MVLVSHHITRPKIRVKLTGLASLDISSMTWMIMEKLWRDYGIDVDIEEEPVYLVNPTAGIYHGYGVVELTVESPNTAKTYTLHLDDEEELSEKLQDFIIGAILNGEPSVSVKMEDALYIEKPGLTETALA